MTMQILPWTADDWDAVPSYMFSADQDRPRPVCHCRSCRSEGYYLADETCLYYRDGLEDV